MNVSQWMDGNRKTSYNGMAVGLLQCCRLNNDDSHCLSHHQHVVCYYVQRHTTPSPTTTENISLAYMDAVVVRCKYSSRTLSSRQALL